MSDISKTFSSPQGYMQSFEKGIIDILQTKTAGTFILACANIFQHSEFQERSKSLLTETYDHITKYYRNCFEQGKEPDDSKDDILVMNKIIDIGFHNIEPLLTRTLASKHGDFQLIFNQLRSLRPARMSKIKDINLDMQFNESGFHFDKPFLKKEIFAEGELKGRNVSLLYNKFPFIDYHALLVIDKDLHNQQYLPQDYLEYIIELEDDIQKKIPNIAITYNSLGAGASVNHLHFQVFLETDQLAIFSDSFTHNGGSVQYPANCIVFSNKDDSWNYIQKLHDENRPYNLIFKNQKVYCLPRNTTFNEIPGLSLSTFGWAEMAGFFTVNDKDVFHNITTDKLIDSIRSLSARQVIQ